MTSSRPDSASREFERLEEEVLAFIDISEDPGEEPFNRLSLSVFEFQFEHNRPYANYCRSLDPPCLPGDVRHWSQIPAVPTDAFKHFGLRLNTKPGDAAKFAAVFRTSGTTGERNAPRGEHGFPSLRLYDASILRAWQDLGLPKLPIRFLTPAPGDAPDSSLSHMMGVLNRSYNTTGSDAFLVRPDGSVAGAPLGSLDAPILLAGTALAFLHLLNSDGLPPLPNGSHLLETGGYKGLAIELDKTEFYEKLSRASKVGVTDIHNEYSMTELSSQFYCRGLEAPHRGPHWTRVRVIDALSGEPATAGSRGFLEIFDLANLASCLALRTADLALAIESDTSKDKSDRSVDRRTFKLIGRDPAVLPRGCSRSADEMLGA